MNLYYLKNVVSEKNKRGKNKGNFQRPNRPYQVWWYRPLVAPLEAQEDLSVSSRLTRDALYIHVSRQSKIRQEQTQPFSYRRNL